MIYFNVYVYRQTIARNFTYTPSGMMETYSEDDVIRQENLYTLRKMKKQYHITEYMEHVYAYCLDNESTIRGHIEEAEKEF